MASDEPGHDGHRSQGAPRISERARRVNLLNRRAAALLFEMAAYYATVGAAVAYLLARYGGESGVLLVAFVAVPFYLLRDVLGPCSPGKRLLGLRLVGGAGGAAPTTARRVLRNVVFLLPVLPLVECLVAYLGNPAMQRLGDFAAGTRVEDVDPQRYGTTSYRGTLALAVACLAGAYWVVTRVV